MWGRIRRGLGIALVISLLVVSGGKAQTPQTAPSGAGKIAFASSRNGDLKIYVMNADGSNVTPLHRGTAPQISSDGRRIVFAGPDLQICIIGVDGSGLTCIALEFGRAPGGDLPTFSPDGQTIAFVKAADTPDGFLAFQIHVMHTDGSGLTRLTNPPDAHTSPAYSPDGKRIAFHSVAGRDTPSQIYIMNADGSHVTRLTNEKQGRNEEPRFSPDGGTLVFGSTRDGRFQIYSMNVDGSKIKRLTDSRGNSWSPSFSPDGRKIAFQSDRDGNDQIHVMDSDGSHVIRLTNGPDRSFYPSFGP